jgi:hypothetical protein
MERCAHDEPPRPDEPLVRDVPTRPTHPATAIAANPTGPSESERARQPLMPKLLVGAGAAVAAVGGGTLIWVWRRYESIKASGCAPSCDPAIVDPPRMGQRVGDVLVLAGVASAAIGGVLWLRSRSTARQQAWLAPAGAGVAIGMTF